MESATVFDVSFFMCVSRPETCGLKASIWIWKTVLSILEEKLGKMKKNSAKKTKMQNEFQNLSRFVSSKVAMYRKMIADSD